MNTSLLDYIAELNANPQMQQYHKQNSQQSALDFGVATSDIKYLTDRDATMNIIGFNSTQTKSIMVGAYNQH